MSRFSKFPGAAPPRAATAAVAVTVTLLVHGAVLGLFHRSSAEHQLLASPQLERQLDNCRAAGERAAQQRCRLAVVARARQAQAETLIAAR
jgi:hypothetical protein